MRIKQIELLHLRIPFRISFRHFLAERHYNDTLIAKVMLQDGTVGYGEGIPRKYLNGETIETALANRHIARFFLRKDVNPDIVADFTNVHARAKRYNALLCAVELAILDAYDKSLGKPVSSIIGKIKHNTVSYTGIISADSILKVVALAYAYKRRNVKHIKIKVGTANDERRIRLVRRIIGNEADIRVDANCAWTAKQAIEKIKMLAKYKISAVEQPVKADDYAGLQAIRKAINMPIIADESLINLEDAEKRLGCADIYNIRLSKCGGIFNSLKLYEFAKKRRKKVMLGCQVGETGILTAAGRAMAACLDFRYVEGSYNKFLLKHDIVKDDLTVKNDFTAKPVRGNGLGVRINERMVKGYSVRRYIV